jgi:hypothetical protein
VKVNEEWGRERWAYEGNDLTQISHDLEVSLVIFVSVRNDHSRSRFPYKVEDGVSIVPQISFILRS